MARTARKPAAPKQDMNEVITNQIIELMEQGVAPWEQPWATTGEAMNMVSKKAYRGINVLILALATSSKGYSSPWWGTYKQISEKGGQVRKGEKGTQIVLWKPVQVDDKKTGEKRSAWFLRTFTVFNAQQADGLDLPTPEARPVIERIEECELALKDYYANGGPSLSFGGDRACYSPSADAVRMPERQDFTSAEEFYGTWFHETVHSTGHASRLARKDLLEMHYFGDPSYSREELVAELGSAFLSARTGISAATIKASASYLHSWISVLKGDPKMLLQAASQAQKAVDRIMGTEAPAEASTAA